MAVLVYVEHSNGEFKKAALEAVHYAHLCANSLGGSVAALVLGIANNTSILGEYGAEKIIHAQSFSGLSDNQSVTKAIAEVMEKENAHTLVIAHSSTGKALAGRLSIRLNAGLVSGVNSVPEESGEGIKVTKSVFSGKATAEFKVTSSKRVLSLMGNSIAPEKVNASGNVESIDLPSSESSYQVIETKTVTGIVPLPEAELVVSAGRGMKGPENWGIIEELATELGATTACSRPVADSDWRPHHEHVGQTGVAIRPNLYIAIGISGAIQHLAGVNNSKVIVVINKDPEAPFFKAADYGVCADLFDVVPRLTSAVRKFKAGN